ncbi:hypothetical protein BBJ28_00017215 [Nothophytophthora sp. Chile5]|nr:hypothetical protein BBJ28_00017215 [Nothophytophthora sp. Chile5]
MKTATAETAARQFEPLDHCCDEEDFEKFDCTGEDTCDTVYRVLRAGPHDAAVQLATPKVVTLWYRASEILFGCESYSCAVDLWACGCSFGELLLQLPLMPGKTDLDQIHRICKVC